MQHPIEAFAVLFAQTPGVIDVGIVVALGVVKQEELVDRHAPKLTGLNAKVPHRQPVVLSPVNVRYFFVFVFVFVFALPPPCEPDFFWGTNAVTITVARSCIMSGLSVVMIAS